MSARHPGLNAVLGKLQRNEPLTDEEVQRLQRQLDELGREADGEREAFEGAGPPVEGEAREPLRGHATRGGGNRFAARRGGEAGGFYRVAQEVVVSTVGIGTYRGPMDTETDRAYAEAVHAALRAGVNLIDTSLNYRRERSERSVAAGLGRFLKEDGGSRDEVVICTKGGYLVPGAIAEATLTAEDVAGGLHCLSPAFLTDQLERSRRNLAVETIDVYYLHNPEMQLEFVDAATFEDRVRAAFAGLESAVAEGAIRYYGTATWDGYRGGRLSLRALANVARDVAGESHHFRFVQLPFNLGAREALTCPAGGGGSVLDVAAELGITVIASASLLQGRLARDLPGELSNVLPGLETDAQRAIQFTRSTPGIAAALVGMRRLEHVAENVAVARVPPLDAAAYARCCSLIRRDG